MATTSTGNYPLTDTLSNNASTATHLAIEVIPFVPTPTATPTNTPVIASFVTSAQYAFANSPTITIPWTPSVTGVDELLCVMIATNNTDNKSVVQQVSYAGNAFTPQLQVPSRQYSEGIEFWTFSLGSYPYSGFPTGNIVITQPSYNTIINDEVTVLEYGGAAQNAFLNVNSASSLQQALQSTTTQCSLISQFQRSFIFSGYSGVKGIQTFPGGFTNLQYAHKYGTWASADHQGPTGPTTYTSAYVSLPPYNPAASVMMAEIPSFSYFTPTITPTPHP